MICAFTGHRPEHLSWGEDEQDARCVALKQQIARLVEKAYEKGCRTFLCGMARGCDTYFAEAVLHARLTREQMRLVAMIPCPSQTFAWPLDQKVRYETLLSACDELITLERTYTQGCMLRRNREMIDLAQLLITVYDGSNGGTGAAVRYAKQRGVPIWPVWL